MSVAIDDQQVDVRQHAEQREEQKDGNTSTAQRDIRAGTTCDAPGDDAAQRVTDWCGHERGAVRTPTVTG